MVDGTSAVGAVFGALGLAYLNSFIAEDFRRFRDGSALAAGLAGELASYAPALPLIRELLSNSIATIDANQRETLNLRKFDLPTDPVFDSGVAKLGLLGPDVVEQVVLTYSNIRAFRTAFVVLNEHEKMGLPELRQRFVACREAIERAAVAGALVQPMLRERAEKPFRPSWWPKGWP